MFCGIGYFWAESNWRNANLGQFLRWRQVPRDFAEVAGTDNPDTLASRSRLAAAYDEHGELTRAESIWRDIVTKLERSGGDQAADFIDACEMLGQNLLKQGRFAEAEPLLRRALEARKVSSGEQIVALYSQSGQPQQAAQWRAKL